MGKGSENDRTMKGAGRPAVIVQEVLTILRYFEGCNNVIPDCHISANVYKILYSLKDEFLYRKGG
jgi:hypothetical protein